MNMGTAREALGGRSGMQGALVVALALLWSKEEGRRGFPRREFKWWPAAGFPAME